ncbi:DUF7697 family protein [Sphingobium sp. YBL2]|uniref:DUF7697 family protein n=1 Tax=Sphingobium sp. (strain YBL2) TaxID=484429 RepID=UPI0005CBBC5D|nr:hypothetical protein [Sphingobium sp. YBL2]AJR24562.1 hypothetical protein TZ53_13355 [Sphingobium sp. YBL2]
MQTEAGASVWDVISGCGRQLRAHMGGPFALDFSAVLTMGQAQQADMKMLAETLPYVEAVVLAQFDKEDGDAEA